MKKKNFLITGIALLGILGLGFAARTVRAETATATVTKLSTIPPRLEIEAKAGEVVNKQVKLRNESNTQLAIQVKIQDFVVADDKGTPQPVTEEVSGRWAASSWITVSPPKFLINPGETKTLDLVAIVPDDATAGGHYAVVFYSPVDAINLPKTGELAGGAGVIPNIGTLVYITVAGDIKEDARVTKMEAPKFQEFGPVNFLSEIKNLSDIHIKPIGAIRIYDMLGNLVTTLKLAEQNIFPTATRTYENTWAQKWGLGKYRATLEAGYGTTGNSLAATVFFWIIPWRALTIALLTIILVVLLIIYFRKPKVIKEDKKEVTKEKK